jgi:hypothetical protein
MFQSSRVAAIISILLLSLALSRRWPFGFYTLLRLTVCASAVYIAFQAHRFNKAVWTWVLGGVAVLFNPIVPIYMRRTPVTRQSVHFIVNGAEAQTVFNSPYGTARVNDFETGAHII